MTAVTNTVASSDMILGIIFLTQTVVGVLGNSYLLYHYLLLHFSGCTLRITDRILVNLTTANILILLCNGVPQTMASFGLKDFLNDFGCKGTFYLHRVGRGVSIGSTSFLGIFQAITISHREFRWAEFKGRQKYISSSLYLSWILYMLISSHTLVYLRAKYKKNNTTNLNDLGYCAATLSNRMNDIFYAALQSVPDFLFLGLMVWASTFMILILYRHKQRMQHISRAKISSRSSPVSRATQTILLLVSTYVFFYALSCIILIYVTFSSCHRVFLMNVCALLTGCFPAVSPFLLMSQESSMPRCFCFIFIKNV